MRGRMRFRRNVRDWGAAVLGLATLAVAVALLLRGTAATTDRLTLTGGSPDGLRHRIAERLAVEGRAHGLALTVSGTPGTEEALDKVNARTLDLALVQGGFDAGARTKLRQVAALHVEPLHLLVKREHHAEVCRHLDALRGKTVNLSEVGSGTYDLAREVLAFAGLQPRRSDGSGDYRATSLSYRQLLAEPDRAQLPDAVFMVSSLPSPVARHLVARRDYRLVPLAFGEAFTLDTLPPPGEIPRGTGRALRVEKNAVFNTRIPAFTYGVEPPVPDESLSTFGTRLLLVAHRDVKSRAVERLLETVFTGEFAQLSVPPLTTALLETAPEFPRHPGALKFQQRNKPLIAGDLIDFVEKGTTILGAALGAIFFLWQWLRQQWRRRRELGFEAYMLKVTAIEDHALQLETAARLDLKVLLPLQMELSRMKSEALQKFAEGELEGEAMISGFISHVNDTRDYLTRLILHEREYLEKQARTQHRSAEALWEEVVGVPPPPHARGAGEEIGP